MQHVPLGTLGKAGRVLDLFVTEKPEWGVREVALRLEMSRSTAHDVLASLAAIQLLQQTRESRYRTGWRVLQLAGGVTEASVLRHAAPARMRELADAGGQSTHLAVWDGREMFFFARAASAMGVTVSAATPGTTLPAHATASGKVLLGQLANKSVLNRTLADRLTRLTPATIVDPARVRADVETARHRGIATSSGETVDGVDALAVPLYGSDGTVVAALGVSMESGRLERYLERHGRQVATTAAAISAAVKRLSAEAAIRTSLRGLALEI